MGVCRHFHAASAHQRAERTTHRSSGLGLLGQEPAGRPDVADTAKEHRIGLHALEEFGKRFAHYTPTSRTEAEQLFKTVTLTRQNFGVASRPHAPLPVIVEFASTSIVKLVSGRARQMEFLLDSLRRNFQSDYSSNQ